MRERLRLGNKARGGAVPEICEALRSVLRETGRKMFCIIVDNVVRMPLDLLSHLCISATRIEQSKASPSAKMRFVGWTPTSQPASIYVSACFIYARILS